jgi:hypothetical protein
MNNPAASFSPAIKRDRRKKSQYVQLKAKKKAKRKE